MIRKIFVRTFLAMSVSLLACSAQASLSTDLQGLVTDANAMNTEIAAVNIGQAGSCTQLGLLNISIEDFLARIENVSAQLTAPLNLTADDMTSLDDLSALSREMASETVRLSLELQSIEDMADIFEYRPALSAMLRLSNDIGTMANRILEMADRILVMAGNINEMADRILVTQELQNANFALTQASILTTQQNMVSLSDSLSSVAYNLSLGLVLDDTERLAGEMEMVDLNPDNMAGELSRLQDLTRLLAGGTVDLSAWMSDVSRDASHYINGDTLTYLVDLSAVHTALASSLDRYAAAIQKLAPLTDTPVLNDATASMLQLTADIGSMSDRIMEMVDKIIIMADNIGLMTDRITETQSLQLDNMELTENALITAQSTTITVIRNMGL